MSISNRLLAWQEPNFRNYLIGGFISNVGNATQDAALMWHIYFLGGRHSIFVGGLGLVRVLPLLIFSLIGGVVADHYDRRSVLLVTQSAMAATALAFGLIEASHHSTVASIYALVALSSIARAFDGPARQAFVVGLVDVKTLPNAIKLSGISWRLSDVLGPVLAGFTIAWAHFGSISGVGAVYLFNFATFFAVLYSVWRLPRRAPLDASADQRLSLARIGESIVEGLHFVQNAPVIRHAMWIDFWATFFASATTLLPAFADKIFHVDAQGYGLLAASTGLGALAGALLMAALPTFKHQGRWVIGMIASFGVFTFLFGFSWNLWSAAFFLAGAGAADMISTVLRQTIRQMETPDYMRGRMNATSSLFHISGPQLGEFEAGALTVYTGERWSVAVGGIACVLIAGNWLRAPALRDYRSEYAGVG